MNEAVKDEVVEVLCLELVLPEADCDQACCSCCSLRSCFAEADLTKGFLFQDDHEEDQAEKMCRPEAPQALVPKQFLKAHCAQQALFSKSCCH